MGGYDFELELRIDEHDDEPCKLEKYSQSHKGVTETWERTEKELNTCKDKIFNLENGLQAKIIIHSTRSGHHFCPKVITVKFNPYSYKTVELDNIDWENFIKVVEQTNENNGKSDKWQKLEKEN